MLSYLISLISSSALPISSIFHIFLLIIIQCSSSGFASTQENNYIVSACNATAGSYTNPSAYQTNLDQVLTNLVKGASDGAVFYNTSQGTGADQVYGIFYCRFDIKSSVCQDCIQAAREQILEDCNTEKTAVIWYEKCTLRFANYYLYSRYENVSAHILHDVTVSNPNQFFNAMSDGITQLIQMTAYNSTKGYAYGEKVVNENQKIHCFVQCRPDTVGRDCEQCLTNGFQKMQKFCKGGNNWGIEMVVNCHIRYDTSPFLNVLTEPTLSTSHQQLLAPAPSQALSPAPSGKNSADRISTRDVIHVVAVIGLPLLLL